MQTKWKRRGRVVAGLAAWVLTQGVASAQDPTKAIKPNKNWVYLLGFVVLLGFILFLAFIAVYYAFAVIARGRKFATAAVVVAPTTAPVAAPAPAPVTAAVPAAAPAAAAPAAAPAAPAAAPAAPPAAEAPAPPAAAPAAAPADTGGVPRIDPNNLPDGIDAVTRGRLKKLAILQERGQEPPAELLKDLESVLGQVTPAAAPAPAAAAPAPAAEAAPAPAAAEEPAPAAEAPAAEAPAAEAPAAAPAPAASTGGLPHIDPNNLPDGIDAVAKGRLKKLAILQERGQEPPADLVEKLKPILDQMA